MKRLPSHPAAALAGIALALAIFSSCKPSSPATGSTPAEKKITIGVSLLNLSAEYIAQLDHAMKAEADKLGVQLVVNDAQLSADRQIQQVESFVAQKLDAVILNPCQVDGSSPAVDAALAAKIPIVNVNSETRAAPSAFVGSQDEDAGRMAMEFIAQKLNGRGSLVMIEGPLGQAAQVKRNQGAREVLARHPELKIIATQSAEWDRAKAITLTENWIESYRGGFDAVLAENDEMAMGALLALEQAGLKKKVVVIGVDGIADALAAVKAGRLDATVFQDANGQGRAAVDVTVSIVRGQPFAKNTLIPFKLITRDNVQEFTK
jgi:inositol transport system substrate-binding protein